MRASQMCKRHTFVGEIVGICECVVKSPTLKRR
uniref:Uncharacterized protein n=1 Tax=Rhizophora mucronata TaxID=61149 RepID=A0A2P2NHT8_RHIMU